MEKRNPVVFAAGTYEIDCPHGSATVHVLRDIGLAEVSDALAPLMECRREPAEREERKVA
ncbi:hypothetical protein AALA69_07745 [Eggerthellaceae bacterium 24-137]